MRLLIPVLLLLAACAPAPQPAEPNMPPSGPVQEQEADLWPPDTHVVLEGEEALALANQCSRVSPGPVEGQWTPSEAEIGAMENDLILLVAREMEETDLSPSPGDYNRQYAGYIVRGARIIYVNGVAQGALTPRWRTEAVRICDGRTITFGVEYDPATRRFANFAFNGGR